MKRRIYRELTLTTFTLALLVSPAWAATLWVNDNASIYVPPAGTSCTHPGYQRIQDAVNAAVVGDVINVCPGTYEEQVVVATAAKSNLTIRSVSPLQAIIDAPAAMAEPGDLVTIDQARNVTLRDFVITGPLPDLLFCSLELRSGVRVKGGGSAFILGNHITEIRAANPALRGCQNGFAIAVGRQFQGQTGTALIHRNVLDRYQKGGIYVDNAGSRADIRYNRLQGEGPVNYIAQNGIQISRGAFAQVRENTVVDHTYSLAPAASSSGMLLFGPPSVAAGTTVEQNFLARNDDNIAVLGSSAVRIADNAAVESTFYDGVYMGPDTSNNSITRNFLRNNAEHDCHDDSVGLNNPPALVANVWSNNNGETENKPGLCRGRDDGDDDDHDDDDHDDDGDRDDEDDDDDNDGKHDDEDSDDDNDGDRDEDDSDDDNDRIDDRHDSKSHKERQKSNLGELGPGEEHSYEMSTSVNSLALIADAAAIGELLSVDGLVVQIFDQAGMLVASSVPLPGPKIATTVPIPGNYVIKVRNQGAAPISYKLSRLVREAWLQ